MLFENDRWNRSLNALPVPSVQRVCDGSVYSSHDLRALTGKSEVVLYRVREYTDRSEMNVSLPRASEKERVGSGSKE